MDLTNLLTKDTLFQSEKFICEKNAEHEFKAKLYWKFVNLFGIHKFWKKKSGLFTKEQITQILVDNSLSNNLEEGLKETEIILEEGLDGDGSYYYSTPRLRAIVYINGKGDVKYRLKSYILKCEWDVF